MFRKSTALAHIDWWLLGSAVFISLVGLVTMYSFSSENTLFEKQAIWISLGVALSIGVSFFDYTLLRRQGPVVILYAGTLAVLAAIFLFGKIALGAKSRFDFGAFALQPADPAKLVLIIVLAKYFMRRHVDIAQFRHIVISGAYASALFALIFFQPDLGSAIIILCIWFMMVLVAGISKKHLAALTIVGILVSGAMWQFAFKQYQKDRILTFLHPMADVRGAGYNVRQAVIAVGSGQWVGKGIGYGTQSKLQFLPEYETDFIFAAYAEEWGFVGVILLITLYGVVIWRILALASRGATNFETLFGVGLAALITSHFIIHAGFNLGLMPVTGITIPFMSYGGSHLLTEYLGLGILMGMSRYSRPTMRGTHNREMVGVGAPL